MKRKWLWVVSGMLAIILATGAYYTIWMSRSADYLRANFGSQVLGVAAGDVIPEEGKVIRVVPSTNPAMNLTVPVVLYPRARVLGVGVSGAYEPHTDSTLLTASILMASDDPEEEVIAYYLSAWQERDAREVKQKSSVVYAEMAPGIEERTVVTTAEDGVFASATAASGPRLCVMDETTHGKWLRDDAELAREPGGETVTTIWLIVPLGDRAAFRASALP